MVLPPNATIFTADAVSMYTNIHTETALQAICTYLHRNEDMVTDLLHIPVNALLEALRLIMTNSIFDSGIPIGCNFQVQPWVPLRHLLMQLYSSQSLKISYLLNLHKTFYYIVVLSTMSLAFGYKHREMLSSFDPSLQE
jgi:hypothetical protein